MTGITIGRHRVARLMRENALKARQRRRFKRTTDSLHAFPVAAYLLNQDFNATGPHQKWGADISYGLCCKDDRRRWEDGINWIRSPLCGGIEKSGNEDRLSSDIASADLSNLPLPDHRHRFETCQCSSGGL